MREVGKRVQSCKHCCQVFCKAQQQYSDSDLILRKKYNQQQQPNDSLSFAIYEEKHPVHPNRAC